MTVAIQNTVREKNSGAAQKNRVVVVGEECARVSAKYTQNQMTQICCSLFCFFFSFFNLSGLYFTVFRRNRNKNSRVSCIANELWRNMAEKERRFVPGVTAQGATGRNSFDFYLSFRCSSKQFGHAISARISAIFLFQTIIYRIP